jgi:SAM-dependent methyltransferase
MYRHLFVHLDAFVGSVRAHVEAAAEILEIGCGDGLVTERLARAFPGSALTGIDICSQPGRLYRGDRAHVRFLRTSSEALSTAEGARFQLVIIADVLHHVPHRNWARFLSSVAPLMADGATLVLKDWVREWTPAYMIGYLSDRFVTGERIRHPDEEELRSLAQSAFGTDAIRSEFRVRPWHCNLALVISPNANPATNGAMRQTDASAQIRRNTP